MEANVTPIKQDLIGEIFDVEEALKVVTMILESSSHDSCSAHWTIRLIARDKLNGLVDEVARIKEQIEAMDF
jgi:hypothetical protein